MNELPTPVKIIAGWIKNVEWALDQHGEVMDPKEKYYEETRVGAWKQALDALGWPYDHKDLKNRV